MKQFSHGLTIWKKKNTLWIKWKQFNSNRENKIKQTTKSRTITLIWDTTHTVECLYSMGFIVGLGQPVSQSYHPDCYIFLSQADNEALSEAQWEKNTIKKKIKNKKQALYYTCLKSAEHSFSVLYTNKGLTIFDQLFQLFDVQSVFGKTKMKV